MEGDTQNEDGDFRGLTFSRIEGEGLGELSSSAGPGWRSFLVFDPGNQRLARLNAVDLDQDTRRRETELKFVAKRAEPSFETVFDHGKDDDSQYFVSSLRLESEPLVDYLNREAPLKPLHGFELIAGYLEALRDSGRFERAPEGLGFFIAERLRISTDTDGRVRLIFCGFGAADDQDSKLPLPERIAALASQMGLEFSVKDLPKTGGLKKFLKWMGSFRGKLPEEEQPVAKPESEIRNWLGEHEGRRAIICEAAPGGMADLVPHVESKNDVEKVKAGLPEPNKEKEPSLHSEKKEKKAAKTEKNRNAKQAHRTAEAAEIEKTAEVPKPQDAENETAPKKTVISQPKATAVGEALPANGRKDKVESPAVVDEITLLERFQDRMRSGNEGSNDDINDLLSDYQASRKRRSSPMALAFFFCTVAAVLIWLVSLNLDFVADSVSRMFGKSRQPRSGFQQYHEEVQAPPVKDSSEKTALPESGGQ